MLKNIYFILFVSIISSHFIVATISVFTDNFTFVSLNETEETETEIDKIEIDKIIHNHNTYDNKYFCINTKINYNTYICNIKNRELINTLYSPPDFC